MKHLINISASLLLTVFSSQLMAQIEVTTVAETEVAKTDAQGNKTVTRNPAVSVVPGTEVIYTITAKNTGTEAASNIVVNNPVPANTVYVDGSAFGADTVITFSVDGGQSYDAPDKLTVKDASGKVRAATAEDYTHVRWTLQVELQPGQQADVWYRARVK